ncbi:MAG: Hsp20/alpha crystallin family protein, partial [Solirubrobacteraceae bacterium]
MAGERDLFANFDRMRREIDELFGDVFERPQLHHHRRAGFTPAVDVAYADGPPRAIVTVALAGIGIDDIELEVRERELVIFGHRRAAPSEGVVYQQVEIEHGPFRRVIALGADVSTQNTRASFEDGILRVELPLLVNEPRGRSVPIQSGEERKT